MKRVKLNFTDFSNFHKAFPTEKSCIKFLENKRWPKGVKSPYDPEAKVYKRGDGKYRCGTTGKNFNVMVGTIFHGSKISLWKWFFAIYMLTSRKKGLSAMQLSRDINITPKSAWLMLQKIRGAFAYTGDMLTGEVELDETFVGGRNKYRHGKLKTMNCQGRAHHDKVSVMGMLQRNGKVICRVTKDTKSENLTPHILENVSSDATLMMDDWCGYNSVQRIYNYHMVDHGHKIYVDGDAYTNNIEGFWGTFCKRAFSGCYNMASGAHMHRYFDEFAFRYNTRKVSDKERFEEFFDNIEYQTTYNEIVNEYRERNRKTLAQIHEEQLPTYIEKQEAKKKAKKEKEMQAKKQQKRRAARQKAKIQAAFQAGLQAGQAQASQG